MAKKSLEKNVKVKLGLLEAKTGKDASISWCKAAVNSRKPSNKVKTLLESTVDPEVAIKDLRRQKVESKFYHVRTKTLPKQMKHVKTLMTQRVVKKIKQKKTENEEGNTEEIKNLEVELGKIKGLDHVKLATWALNTQIFKKDEYLQEKLNDLGISIAETEKIPEADKVMSVKCFQDAIKACRSDLTNFMKKLLHEATAIEAKKPKQINEADEGGKRSLKPLSADKSFFMASLNADDSEEDDLSDFGSDGDEGNYGRVAFTDDEDESDGGGFDSEEDVKRPKKKKNRLGQVARRRLAEKMYGREAKHIKSGGLTVQQREEQRKLKSQQRKERAERIKKDAKRPVARGSKEIVESFKGTTKPNSSEPSALKIDPNMHPSWAAKLQQQAKLQQTSFQGQKIKFDDE